MRCVSGNRYSGLRMIFVHIMCSVLATTGENLLRSMQSSLTASTRKHNDAERGTRESTQVRTRACVLYVASKTFMN